MNRTARRLIGAWLFVVAANVAGVSAQDAPSSARNLSSVDAFFTDATAKETAVRKALSAPNPAPTVLKAVRTVVADYDSLVRRYPSSGYCDDALWRAAKLSIEAFDEFGDAREQAAAVRLLQQLTSGYPSSRFSKMVPAELAAVRGVEPRETVRIEEPAVALTRAAPDPLPSPPARASASSASAARTPAGTLASIKEIRRAAVGDVMRVVVELDMEVPFHDERLENPDRVFVDLSSTRLNPALVDHTLRYDGDADPVRQVRVGRHPNNTTRVVLEAAGISSYSVYPLYNPFRLVIDCMRAESVAAVQPLPSLPSPKSVVLPALAARPLPARSVALSLVAIPAGAPSASARFADVLAERAAPPPAAPVAPLAAAPALPVVAPPIAPLPSSPVGPPARNVAGGFSIARQLGMGVSRIVIDPGHGGHDPGAKGSGTSEAELVLDVALRLEKLMAKLEGVEVVLTRRTDDYVSLQARTAIANHDAADLFLSIHANASNNRQVRGVETYFLNFASNLSAAAVAARENAASGQSMAELPDVVKSIALSSKLDESRDFATYVQREMVSKMRGASKDVKDLGVKQAPFVVLIGAAMPSILTEISFMTNAQDMKLLKSSAYRQRIAEALFNGIRKYQASLQNVQTIAEKP